MRGVLTHYRRDSERKLPALDKLELSGPGTDSTSTSVHGLLRTIAVASRNCDFQRFYSIRSVATHFHVPPSTVMRIYRRLCSERLLRMVWGSRTLLEPAEKAKQKRPNIIGLPIPLLRFTNSPDYRSEIFKLQSQIWNCAASERLLFFADYGDAVLEACRRCGPGGIQMVIWLFPDACHRDALLRLNDSGMTVICIGHSPASGIPNYHIVSRKRSAASIVRERILG